MAINNVGSKGANIELGSTQQQEKASADSKSEKGEAKVVNQTTLNKSTADGMDVKATGKAESLKAGQKAEKARKKQEYTLGQKRLVAIAGICTTVGAISIAPGLIALLSVGVPAGLAVLGGSAALLGVGRWVSKKLDKDATVPVGTSCSKPAQSSFSITIPHNCASPSTTAGKNDVKGGNKG